ncbi:MAG: hypothetical protein IJQ73_06000 [Kiritimatiellae bacterium]|nr:hypothetical protein [Kiritimatiellia bacterium]
MKMENGELKMENAEEDTTLKVNIELPEEPPTYLDCTVSFRGVSKLVKLRKPDGSVFDSEDLLRLAQDHEYLGELIDAARERGEVAEVAQ